MLPDAPTSAALLVAAVIAVLLVVMRATMASIAASALRRNSEQFLQLAGEHLGRRNDAARGDLREQVLQVDGLVQPLKASLDAVRLQVTELEQQRVASLARVEHEVESLRSAAASLATALRAPKARGRWGELQLRRVVEAAGMLAHCDFLEQPSSERSVDGEGPARRLLPDLVVHLAGGRSLVVDAKSPMDSWLAAVDATEAKERERRGREHAARVSQHVVELSRKQYWRQLERTPEFVIMFLPAEDLFAAALEHDPGLIERAAAMDVMIATPTSLITLLRSVAYGWREAALEGRAREVQQLGRDLYDRAAVLVEHWAAVGRHLGGAVQGYNAAVGSLESRLLVTARRLHDLDVASERALPSAEEITTVVRPSPLPARTSASRPVDPAA